MELKVVTTNAATILRIKQDHLLFNEGDKFVAYFEKNGKNYLCGLTNYMSNIENKLLPCYNNDQDDVNFNGVPNGEEIKLGLLRDNVIYEMQAGKIGLWDGYNASPKQEITALGIAVYHIENLTILTQTVEVEEVPWIAYDNSLCPVFDYPEITRSFAVEYIHTKTGKKQFWSNMKVWRVPCVNAKSQTLSIVEGMGRLMGDKYYFNKADIDKGYIILCWTATPKLGCGIKTNPICIVTYNLDKLP